jgi:antitoxin component YwqK of YwqJK toxin-antitoxin module
MKRFLHLFLVIALIGLNACSNEPSAKPQKEKAPEKLVEIKDGQYTEWYPGKKHVKYQGALDKKGNREGKWNFYSEKGTLLSFTFYQAGKKNGHSVVKYPNGSIHYYGQYQNDQMVGEWVTYDLKGNKTVKLYE